MEYIQCTNCAKKYNVNDKVRAFIGSDIKCKSCQKTFTIEIHNTEKTKSESTQPEHKEEKSTQAPSPTNTQAETTEDVKDDKAPTEQTESADKPKKKKLNTQLITTIFLAITLVAALLYLIFMDTLLSGNTASTQNKVVQPIVNPQISIPTEKDLQMDEKTSEPVKTTDETSPITPVSKQDNAQESKEVKPKIIKPEPEETQKVVAKQKIYSPECKKAAASQWSIDSTIYHKELPNAKYMQLLDLSQEQSAIVRELCKDDQVIQEILEAAKNKTKPSWF